MTMMMTTMTGGGDNAGQIGRLSSFDLLSTLATLYWRLWQVIFHDDLHDHGDHGNYDDLVCNQLIDQVQEGAL